MGDRHPRRGKSESLNHDPNSFFSDLTSCVLFKETSHAALTGYTSFVRSPIEFSTSTAVCATACDTHTSPHRQFGYALRLFGRLVFPN